MDTLSHGLWGGAAAKIINTKIKKPLNVKRVVLWGLFPDFFSFTLLFVWLFWSLAFGDVSFSDWPRPDAAEPIKRDTLFIFQLTNTLYSLSHSLVVFSAVFGLIFAFLRRAPWEMSAWFLHILMDIPTHTYKFYPTPFLWPISDIKLDGFSWAAPWFMAINYSLLGLIYLYFYLKNKHNKIV